MRRLLPLLFSVVLLLCASSYADVFSYYANLSGPNEFPANASLGTGFTTVTYNSTTHSLHVVVDFANLTGTTTASHIHCCVDPSAANPTAGVATTTPTFLGFPLGVTSGHYDSTLDLTQAGSWNPAFITAHGNTTAGAEAFFVAGLAAGEEYLNVHTSFRPAGEIRGFLAPVPEPASITLLAIPLLGMLTRRKLRR
jgi:hypothetical protein